MNANLEFIKQMRNDMAEKVAQALIEFELNTGLFVDHIEIQRTAPQGGRTRIAMVKIIADVTE